MSPDRSATSDPHDRRPASRSLGIARTRPSCSTEETKGEMAMISPETEASRVLRKAADLLNSVAETAWATCAAERACAFRHAIRLVSDGGPCA